MKPIATKTFLPIKDIVIEVGNVRILGNGMWGKAISSLVSKTTKNSKTFILTAPTNVLRNILTQVKDQVDEETLIINCSKGIELDSHKLPFEIAEDVLGSKINYFSLIGPSFAQEVVEQNPTIVNLGYRNPKYLEQAKAIFQSDYFKLEPTKCLPAIELMGAFKNIYAIGCGIASGFGYGTNTRTKLIITAYQELKKLLTALGYEYDQSAQIAFMGDLVLTCSSTESRNFTLGKMLVNNSAEKSLTEIGQIIEGVFSAASVDYFEKKAGIKLPLAKLINDIVDHNDQDFTKKSFIDFITK